LGTGIAALNTTVEASFATSLLTSIPAPESPAEVGVFLRLDNAGEDNDDRLPNSGFQYGVPEPGSMMLLGMGILGLFGLRRKS
jgi:hypothetical protein